MRTRESPEDPLPKSARLHYSAILPRCSNMNRVSSSSSPHSRVGLLRELARSALEAGYRRRITESRKVPGRRGGLSKFRAELASGRPSTRVVPSTGSRIRQAATPSEPRFRELIRHSSRLVACGFPFTRRMNAPDSSRGFSLRPVGHPRLLTGLCASLARNLQISCLRPS